MKRVLLGLILALMLVLALASTALAAPVSTAPADSFFVFGEYAPIYLFWPPNLFLVGAGYAVSDDFAIGLQVQTMGGFMVYGGFAQASIGPVVLSGDVLYNGEIFGRVAGVYRFDLEGLFLGVGGGVIVVPPGGPPTTNAFLEVSASGTIEHFSLYGAIDYYVYGIVGLVDYKVGMSYAF